MERVAEFVWRRETPPAVDEQLILYDDGTAWLVMRRPRMMSPTIGSFVTRPSSGDWRTLAAAGPGPVTIDLLHPPAEPHIAALTTVLDRICGAARETPHAAASFYVRVTPSEPGNAVLSLLAVGEGKRAVQIELDPAAGAVHFSANGQPLAWIELPELHTGFVTPTAQGLGGLRSAAVIEPGVYGAITIPVSVPEGADAVDIQVAGWLRAALPDDDMPEPFEARTDQAPLASL